MTTAVYNAASNSNIMKAKEVDAMYVSGMQLIKACRNYNASNPQHQQVLNSQIDKMITFFKKRGVITSILLEEGGYDYAGEVKRMIEKRPVVIAEVKQKLDAAEGDEKVYLQKIYDSLTTSISAEEEVMTKLKELQQLICTMNLSNPDTLGMFLKTVSSKIVLSDTAKVYKQFLVDECMVILSAVEKNLK